MSSETSDNHEELKQIAKDRMAEMPAETALGNADPAGGGEGDPKDFLGNSDVPLPE